MVEEHIIGVPGDDFIENFLEREDLNEVRLAKEFIKFNERCFVRLLGDMRAYNYVVEMTPDLNITSTVFEPSISTSNATRAGNHFIFLNFSRITFPWLSLCSRLINLETSHQYQREERTIKRRFNVAPTRITKLRECMCEDHISSDSKLLSLRSELTKMHNDSRFDQCKTMGEVTFLNIAIALDLKEEVPPRLK